MSSCKSLIMKSPDTGRRIKRGGKTYRNLIKKGMLNPKYEGVVLGPEYNTGQGSVGQKLIKIGGRTHNMHVREGKIPVPEGYVFNMSSGRVIKSGTSLYKKLKREGVELFEAGEYVYGYTKNPAKVRRGKELAEMRKMGRRSPRTGRRSPRTGRRSPRTGRRSPRGKSYSSSSNDTVINPRSGRPIKVGGKTFNNLTPQEQKTAITSSSPLF